MITGVLSVKSPASHGRALLALTKKGWLHFVRYPTWVVAMLFLPLVFTLQYVYVAKTFAGPQGDALAGFAAQAGTADYVSFLTIGLLIWLHLNSMLWDIGHSLRMEQMRGTLEHNWLCPVPRILLLIGGSLIHVVISLFWIALVLGQVALLFGLSLQGNLWLAALIMLVMSVAVYGFGFCFAALVLVHKEPDALTNLVQSILLVLCGTIYPISILPGPLQSVAKGFPLTWGIADLRAVLLQGRSFTDVSGNLAVLAIFAVAFPCLGYLAFRLVEGFVRRRGTLSHY
ncbi:MAG: ABC transporter permease [Bacillota bacterium]